MSHHRHHPPVHEPTPLSDYEDDEVQYLGAKSEACSTLGKREGRTVFVMVRSFSDLTKVALCTEINNDGLCAISGSPCTMETAF